MTEVSAGETWAAYREAMTMTTPQGPVAVYLVTEDVDAETHQDYGVFSTDERARGYIGRTAKGGARWRKDGQAAEAVHGGATWAIEPMIVDALDAPDAVPDMARLTEAIAEVKAVARRLRGQLPALGGSGGWTLDAWSAALFEAVNGAEDAYNCVGDDRAVVLEAMQASDQGWGEGSRATRCWHCGAPITLLDGAWTDDDGRARCMEVGAAFVPHKPTPEDSTEAEVSPGETPAAPGEGQ